MPPYLGLSAATLTRVRGLSVFLKGDLAVIFTAIRTRPGGSARVEQLMVCPACGFNRRAPQHYRMGYVQCDRCVRAATRTAMANIARPGR